MNDAQKQQKLAELLRQEVQKKLESVFSQKKSPLQQTVTIGVRG